MITKLCKIRKIGTLVIYRKLIRLPVNYNLLNRNMNTFLTFKNMGGMILMTIPSTEWSITLPFQTQWHNNHFNTIRSLNVVQRRCLLGLSKELDRGTNAPPKISLPWSMDISVHISTDISEHIYVHNKRITKISLFQVSPMENWGLFYGGWHGK
jgi:hypothetical protein